MMTTYSQTEKILTALLAFHQVSERVPDDVIYVNEELFLDGFLQ